MKTHTNLKKSYDQARLPEVIIWVISILVFMSLLFGFKVDAQEVEKYNQDTLWLKSGQVIPCEITSDKKTSNSLSVTYRDQMGQLIYDQIPRASIFRYKREGSEEETFTELFKLEFNDGTTLIGSILKESETEIEFQMPELGIMTINKEKVKRVIPLESSGRVGKSYWFKNPHSTRLLFAPTAIPLRRGEGYYQNIYIVVNMFNYGVANNFSIGGGFDFITMLARTDGEWSPMLNFNIKSGFKVSKNFHAGVGGMYVTMPGEFSAGILYGLGTVGSYNSNLTMGLGWGFVDGTFEPKPFIMIGGMARISEKLWFVSENWIAPVDNDKYYFVFSYGIRFAAKRIAVDLAFINSKDIFEGIVIGVPFVDFVIKLGKR